MEDYKVDKKYWKLLNLDSMKLILIESNMLLGETLDSIKSITNKSNDLFKILIVALLALIGFIFTSENVSLFLYIMSAYFIVLLFIVVFILYSAIYPKLNALTGTEPKNILKDSIVKYDADNNELMIYAVKINSNQNAINKNRGVLYGLLNKYKLAIKIIAGGIILSFFLAPLCRVLVAFLHKY